MDRFYHQILLHNFSTKHSVQFFVNKYHIYIAKTTLHILCSLEFQKRLDTAYLQGNIEGLFSIILSFNLYGSTIHTIQHL